MLLQPKALLKQDTLTAGLKCLTFLTVLRGTLGPPSPDLAQPRATQDRPAHARTGSGTPREEG